MFYLLLGTPPNERIPDQIVNEKLIDRRPESNIYHVPSFFDGYVLSNDLCFIMVKLLCANTARRYRDLEDIKTDLETLRENIKQTPSQLRKVLSHPAL